MKRTALALMLLASLAACSTTSPDVVRRHDAQRMSTVQEGTIISLRSVKVEGSQSGAGAVAGGVVGGVAGSSVGGRRESVAVGVLGAVAGAVIGNAIERNTTQEDALEIMVRLRNGEQRAIVQAKGAETLMVGDAVHIISSGQTVRVTRAPNAAPATAPAPVLSHPR